MIESLLKCGSGLVFVILYHLACPVVAEAQIVPDTLRWQIVNAAGEGILGATVSLKDKSQGVASDAEGCISWVLPKGYPEQLRIASIGNQSVDTVLIGPPTRSLSLKPADHALESVVVSATLTPTLRSDSPIPVEVYTRTFLLANPTPSLFDAMQNVNGVRPQLNCNVCNTGDIHINGLEGPYTMVTIDGMPIVSGLASVYGLLGIPIAMIERVEVVKGPAGSLYGSESMGGLINVITREVSRAPRLAIDAFSSDWADMSVDLGVTHRAGRHARMLTSANAYVFNNRIDRNGDNFTDLTLAQRLSIFQKWSFPTGALKGLDLAGRGLLESRWGGELDFDPEQHRGSDIKYGEVIDTRRVELLGKYALPGVPGLNVNLSLNYHQQKSDYGTTNYDAEQGIAFTQLTLARKLAKHQLLLGAAGRYTYYDDDTYATRLPDGANKADKVLLPGIFIQDEWARGRHRLLGGMRIDHDPRHGLIYTPRVAYKLPLGEGFNGRINFGTGFRVVNLFTEEHAALSGARTVVIAESLKPERSSSINVNLDKRWTASGNQVWTIETSAWYTRFSNQIIPDYLSNVTEIRYDNLSGFSRSRGWNAELRWRGENFGASVGTTFSDVATVENQVAQRPLLSERWSGVAAADYTFHRIPASLGRFSLNYTSSFYGAMLLPVQGPLDPRPAQSPFFSLQNLQLTWLPQNSNFELYGGCKNILGFTPPGNAIARSHDPFDKLVSFDAQGKPQPTAENPQALVFDPSYVYASNQGRRAFLGLRYVIK